MFRGHARACSLHPSSLPPIVISSLRIKTVQPTGESGPAFIFCGFEMSRVCYAHGSHQATTLDLYGRSMGWRDRSGHFWVCHVCRGAAKVSPPYSTSIYYKLTMSGRNESSTDLGIPQEARIRNVEIVHVDKCKRGLWVRCSKADIEYKVRDHFDHTLTDEARRRGYRWDLHEQFLTF